MDFTKEYSVADKYVIINANDPSLRPVVIQLPKPPDLKLIDGYGLPKHEQYFKRKETPIKLKQIEIRAKKEIEKYNEKNSNNRGNGFDIQKEFWKIVEDEKDSLENELTWIKNNHWYIRYGYWFYNFGKPTWITGWHYYYLNFHYITEAKSYPDYRDVDRRNNIGKWYGYTSTETFKELDKEGNPITLEMREIGRRIYFGDIKPKRRREGATSQGLAVGKCIMSSNKSAFCDIVADEGDHAEDIFKNKLAVSWSHTPLWLKPVWDGQEIPTTNLKLTYPKTELKEECLGSQFSYTKKSTDRALDSGQYMFVLLDEEGKGRVRGNVNSAWAIIKETLAQDLIIHGWSTHPSTVEEIVDGGGEYRTLFEMSDFYKRKPSGQTVSGLIRMFNPAYDGMDGFIDRWGYSVIDKPTEDQLKYPAFKNPVYANENKGAKQSLQDELDSYLNDGSQEKLKAYRQLLRKKPMFLSDCWKGSAGDIGFNIIIIDKAIVDSKYKKVLQGNFEWAGGIPDTKVIFKEDKKGKWFVSDLFLGRDNKSIRKRANYRNPNTGEYEIVRTPQFPNITTGGFDSFRFRASSQVKNTSYGENTNLSDGGLAVLLNYDSSVDGDKPEHEWDTPRFICTYRARPELDIFCEDAIKTFVYYGCMCNGERNTEYFIDYFIKRGYAGYLLYLMDSAGVVSNQPCTYSGGVSSAPKNDMLALTKQHIDLHGHKECHVDLLNEWKNLSSPEDLHTKDLAASAGWALYGYAKGYQRVYERVTKGNVIDISGLLPRRI